MNENKTLDKVITEALINVEVTHPPLLELAKKKFTELANNQKDGDILTLINEWAKTKDIDNYILAPNNSGGGALGNRGNYSYVDKHSLANWDLWAYIPQCEHWKAVALSLDIEPPENSYQVKGWPSEYDRRLKITSAHIECKSLPRSKTDFNKVDLSVFNTWAQSLGWSLPDRFPHDVEVKAVTQTEPITTTQTTYEPRNAVGKLAIKALIEIEKSTAKKATAKQVMDLLQKWADAGDEPDILTRSDKPKHAVIWITSDRKEKDYTVEACQKTLKEFDRNRD